MLHARWLSVSFFGLLLVCGAAQADQLKFTANLAPGQGSRVRQVPPRRLQYRDQDLTWSVEYSGLSGPATAAHIHGPADPGADAGVVVPFNGNLASPIKGSATLTDTQIAQLEAGKWYVNIHTAANKGGEIRGQLVHAS
jgi:hypothetical protein